jgi:hypothetical protein
VALWTRSVGSFTSSVPIQSESSGSTSGATSRAGETGSLMWRRMSANGSLTPGNGRVPVVIS